MFRVRVLGGFAMGAAFGAPSPTLPKRRAEALLSVLAVSGGLGCTRERLAALLWPESDEERARHGLRDCLHDIRQAFGHGAVTGGARLRLEDAVVESDVQQFSRARTSGGPEEMTRLYAGPLLDGFHIDAAPEFEHWLDGERARLAREYGEALLDLAKAAERNGKLQDAVGWWARAVAHDPLSSHLVLCHVRALAAMGDRAGAIRVADAHALRLRTELELEPDCGLILEIERIRTAGSASPRGPAREVGTAPGVERPAPATAGPRMRWVAMAIGVLLLAAVAGTRWMRATAEASHLRETSIAVLPFRNLSPDSANAHFAAGLQDELLTQLGKVAALRVVSRGSVGEYGESTKPIHQVGEELGVGSIALGSVQVDGNRLRVIVRLVDPQTQTDLWSEHYDRTLDDAFAVQSEIARQIVAALGARLTTAEAGAIDEPPTANPEAYQLYLQGLDYYRRPGLIRQNLLAAERLFSRAVALDSLFGPAHAALALVVLDRIQIGYGTTVAELESVRREAENAVRLSPGLPEAHLALGMSLLWRGNYADSALTEFQAGLRAAPNHPELLAMVAAAHRRQGDWNGELAAMERAVRLNPRATNLLQKLGDIYHMLHRFSEAVAAYRTELVMAPDLVQPHRSLGWSYVLSSGQTDTLRASLRGVPLDADAELGAASVLHERIVLSMLEGHSDSVLMFVRESRNRGSDAGLRLVDHWYWTLPSYRRLGDTTAVRATVDSLAALSDSALRVAPDDPGMRELRATVLALRGRRREALREAQGLVSWFRERRVPEDKWRVTRVRLLMLSGELDSAFAHLEPLVAGPSLTTVHYLRLDPWWDPITKDPRFDGLFTKYAGR